MTHLSDQELVTHYLTTTDERSFALLYTRHRPHVYRRCLSLCQDADEAEDLTQDIFIKLGPRLWSFKGESRFSTWLHVVTTNYCLDHLRKRQHQQMHHQRYIDAVLTPDHGPDGLDEASFRVLDRAISHLPPYQQRLLRLKYEEGTEISEMARREQLTPSAMKMRIKRARDRARTLYRRLYVCSE